MLSSGDLLFSTSKDHKPTLWMARTGERVGTYNGHAGSVWYCDVNFSSTRLITASADTTAKLWDVATGRELFEFKHEAAVRCANFAVGDHMVLTVQDSSFNQTPTVFVYNINEEMTPDCAEPVRALEAPSSRGSRFNVAVWSSLNQNIITCGEDGFIRVWDVEKGKEIQKVHAHDKNIANMQLSKDQTMLITASHDHTAKLFDLKSLEHLKTYSSNRPLNAAAISPKYLQAIVGGGQEAMDVTTTGAKAGHFEVDFHHLVYQDYMGCVKGHFGPVHTLAFSPDNSSYASGSEDGYIRLHIFNEAYHSNKFNTFTKE